MKLAMLTSLAVALLAVSACNSTTVRGPQGQSMTATAPRSMSIQRGGSTTLEVQIDRERMTGAVNVSIFQLPNGVTADESSINAETTSATFILKASRDADLVKNQAVGVKIEDAEGHSATQYINLTVTD